MLIHRSFICFRCKNEEKCKGKEPPSLELGSKKNRITQTRAYILKYQVYRKKCLMGQLDWTEEEKRIELEDMDREATMWIENIKSNIEVE